MSLMELPAEGQPLSSARDYYRGAVEAGKTMEEMATERHAKAWTVYVTLSNHGLLGRYRELHPYPYLHPRDALAYYTAAVDDGKTKDEMAQERGIKITSMDSILRHYGLFEEYRRKHPQPEPIRPSRRDTHPSWHKYEGLEVFIETAPTLQELGEYYKVHRERIRQVLNYMGLHGKWEGYRRAHRAGKKEAAIERVEAVAMLARVLYSAAMQRAGDDIAAVKALEYWHGRQRRGHRICFEDLALFLGKYYEAKQAGERLPLEELTRGAAISAGGAGIILKKIGEEPLYGAHERKQPSREQRGLIERALEIESSLTLADRARLAGVPYHALIYRPHRPRRKRRPSLPSFFGDGILNYTKALDLFEGLDAGFSREEAKEYAGIKNDGAADFLEGARQEIETEVERFKALAGLRTAATQ